MTIFGWDASHFDGPLSPSILARARSEGISFFTHKIAEGLTDTEGTGDDTALAAARSAGMIGVGGYVIPRSNLLLSQQVDYWIRLADSGEPWWRDFPGWFWQIDLERWPYDNVAASIGVTAAQRLRSRSGKKVVLYASNGQYRDELAGWDGPLWNADYVSAPAGSPQAMYPGDGWRPSHGSWQGGWAPYSSHEEGPALLQFTSSAVIAGLITCDANAFRGSESELRTLIGGGMEQTDPIKGNKSRGNSVGDGLADTGNFRDWWYDPPGKDGNNPPPAGSRADLLMKFILSGGQLSDDQVQAQADRIATALVASNANGLTAADHAAVVEDVKAALRAGTA